MSSVSLQHPLLPPNGQQGKRDIWIHSIIILSCVVTDFRKNGKSTLIGVEYKPMLPVASTMEA